MEGKKDINYWNDETQCCGSFSEIGGVYKARNNKSRFSEIEDRSNSSNDWSLLY